MGRRKTEVAPRFWAKVDKAGPLPDDRPELGVCWLWTSSITPAPHGYPLFWLDGKYVGAHRVAVLLAGDPIPEGMEVDHLCRRRHCVRRSHLDVVTPKVNSQRAGVYRVQETCDRGHSMDDAKVGRPGHRQCRTCVNENARTHYVPRVRAPQTRRPNGTFAPG